VSDDKEPGEPAWVRIVLIALAMLALLGIPVAIDYFLR
jgi:hypothetical protein